MIETPGRGRDTLLKIFVLGAAFLSLCRSVSHLFGRLTLGRSAVGWSIDESMVQSIDQSIRQSLD